MSGYHSMRVPVETLEQSMTDVVLKSNHADFSMNQLVNAIASDPESWRENFAQPGFTIRTKDGSVRDTGDFKQVEALEKSPCIDRDLVQWKKYAYENGNFLQTPGTYATSVIRDCMFGKCTFCRYNGPEMTFSMMDVEKSLNEYQELIEKYHVKEIFDDSGVWYRGEDARRFARGIIERGLHKKGCYFGFNTRFEYLDEETIALLAKANFRFILIGLESGHQTSLDRIDKGYRTEHVEKTLRWMKKYGMHPHLTIMVGYYWETREMLDATVKKVRSIMFRGLARTLQVTLCTPLDHTPYHKECISEGVLLAKSYDDFDMSRLIVKTPLPHEEYGKAIRKMYGVAFHPLFILRQILFLFRFRLRDWQFLFTYGWRAIRRVRNHIFNLTVANQKKEVSQ